MKPIALPKGSTIICPCCGLRLLKVKENVFKGQKILASLFRPICPNLNGEFMCCPDCKEGFFILGKYFMTEELGLLPKYDV